jgi:hypothetical protein
MSLLTVSPPALVVMRVNERRTIRFDWTQGVPAGITLAFSHFRIHGVNAAGRLIEQAIVGVSYDQPTQAVTYTTATPHGFIVNDIVTINGASIWENNGQFRVDLVPSPTTFRLFGIFGSIPSGSSLTVTAALDESTILFDPPYNALSAIVRVQPRAVGDLYELVNTVMPDDLMQTLEQRLRIQVAQ